MNIYVNDVHILYIILITFISSLILVPLIRDIAVHINAMDIPDKRKVHKKVKKIFSNKNLSYKKLGFVYNLSRLYNLLRLLTK